MIMNVTDAEMDLLQDAWIISDNCIHWDDVADIDKVRAMTWLEDRRVEKEANGF